MDQPLYLIATIYPQPEHHQFLKNEFNQLMKSSYAEPGCQMYDLVATEGENCWVMMEKWRSRADWDNHMKTDHVIHINSLDKKYFLKPTTLQFLDPVS